MNEIEKAVNAQRDVLLMAVNSDDYTQARCANYLSPERVRELLGLEARAPSPAVREAAQRLVDNIRERGLVGATGWTEWEALDAALSGSAPAAPTYDDAVRALAPFLPEWVDTVVRERGRLRMFGKYAFPEYLGPDWSYNSSIPDPNYPGEFMTVKEFRFLNVPECDGGDGTSLRRIEAGKAVTP